jgi:hypothetical protein
LSAHLRAVHHRQADIENDRRRMHRPGRRQGGQSISGNVHAETLARDVHAQQIGDSALVLDHEDQSARCVSRHWTRLSDPEGSTDGKRSGLDQFRVNLV